MQIGYPTIVKIISFMQSPCRDSPFIVNMNEGNDGGLVGKSSYEYVWPVRREASWVAPVPYTDPQTGLMWARDGNIAGKGMKWNDAMNWAKGLTHAGYSDWRLPTREELVSFARWGGNRPSDWFNSNGFINVQSRNYWSSSDDADCSHLAWSVNSVTGKADNNVKYNNNYYVWPVRGR